MKYCFNILSLFFFVICSGQTKVLSEGNGFELTGKLLGRDTGYIVLWYPNTQGLWVRDTSTVENGNFKFTGAVKEPSFAHLIGSKKEGNYSNFFLEAGAQHAELEENNFDKALIKGSKTQELYDSLQNEINKISAQVIDLQNQKSNLDSLLKLQKSNVSSKEQEQKIYELDNKIKALFDEGIKMRVSFIRSHPDSYVSVTELSGLMVVQLYPVYLAKPLYEALSTKVKNSAAGLYCLKEIQARSKLTAGNYLPNFQADDMNNKPVALNDFKNNFVLLDFWASWCVPCREAIPHLKQAYTQYHSRDFEIIAISLDRNKDQWKKAIQADRTGNWVHVLLGSEMKSIFEPIQAIPQQILLDRSGKILWSSLENNTSTWTEILENQIKDGSDN